MGAWWANGRWWVQGWIEAPAPHRHRRPPPAHPARIPGCRSQPKGAKCSQKWPNVAKRGQSGRKWPKVVIVSPAGLSSNRKHSSMQTSPQPLMQPTAFLIQRHSDIADVNARKTLNLPHPNFGRLGIFSMFGGASFQPYFLIAKNSTSINNHNRPLFHLGFFVPCKYNLADTSRSTKFCSIYQMF